jgi:hypothetical protein
MAGIDALHASLDLLVLKILSRRPRLHGCAIMAAITSASGEVRRAEDGSLNPALIGWRKRVGSNGQPQAEDNWEWKSRAGGPSA